MSDLGRFPSNKDDWSAIPLSEIIKNIQMQNKFEKHLSFIHNFDEDKLNLQNYYKNTQNG